MPQVLRGSSGGGADVQSPAPAPALPLLHVVWAGCSAAAAGRAHTVWSGLQDAARWPWLLRAVSVLHDDLRRAAPAVEHGCKCCRCCRPPEAAGSGIGHGGPVSSSGCGAANAGSGSDAGHGAAAAFRASAPAMRGRRAAASGLASRCAAQDWARSVYRKGKMESESVRGRALGREAGGKGGRRARRPLEGLALRRRVSYSFFIPPASATQGNIGVRYFFGSLRG